MGPDVLVVLAGQLSALAFGIGGVLSGGGLKLQQANGGVTQGEQGAEFGGLGSGHLVGDRRAVRDLGERAVGRALPGSRPGVRKRRFGRPAGLSGRRGPGETTGCGAGGDAGEAAGEGLDGVAGGGDGQVVGAVGAAGRAQLRRAPIRGGRGSTR